MAFNHQLFLQKAPSLIFDKPNKVKTKQDISYIRVLETLEKP